MENIANKVASMALAAALAVDHAVAAAGAATPDQTITRAGSQAAFAGPTVYFTGSVRVDPLTAINANVNVASAYVSFEAAARSAWHTHPSGQNLVVISGRGLTQQWGQPVQQLQPGDVVWCPPGVKHWHGAAPDSAMVHLAMTGAADGKSVTWMEKVSDEQYQAH